MNTFLKSSTMFIGILFAIFVAILAILYITEVSTQETLVDWLLKGGLIAVVLLLLSWVFSLTGNRAK